jgi:phage shock protein PspC (stress-responsive transcriptional regulator)
MTAEPSVLGLFLTIGVVFGALAAVSAYVIALNEYRQRMLRLDQNPRQMALQVAVTTFVFMIGATVVLYFALKPK